MAIKPKFECHEQKGKFFIIKNKDYTDMDGHCNQSYETIAQCFTQANAQLLLKAITKFIDEESTQGGRLWF